MSIYGDEEPSLANEAITIPDYTSPPAPAMAGMGGGMTGGGGQPSGGAAAGLVRQQRVAVEQCYFGFH
jgi:hypothetical protein